MVEDNIHKNLLCSLIYPIKVSEILDHSTVGVVLNLNDNTVRFEQEKEVSNHYVKKDTLIDLRLLLVNYFNEILIEVNK